MNTIRYIALAGNVLFFLWIIYNGIDEGFKAIGSVQAIALITLLALLLINIVLLSRQK